MPVTTGEEAATVAPEQSVAWDGNVHSYRPAPDWKDRVVPELLMHSEVDSDLDPVTYEVLRNRLWTINIAHGETITNISGSVIFQVLDFNMTILTEDAELVMNGPYLQYLNSGATPIIRYIMEHYSGEPGIEDGDMYLTNDPWIGAAHQMDVTIACPVFIDGRLFGWVSNAAHQYDLGGVVPGGWPQNAVDVYYDPALFRPMKLIEKGTMRSDLHQMYLRQSRLPDLVALDLRAQIAGCRSAAERIKEACTEFGAPTVKAAMRRILDNAQEGLANKLSRVPDGTWREIYHLDEKLPGDRFTHRAQVNVRKESDRLVVDNVGTEEQTDGPVGFTYNTFVGGVTGILAVTMLYEHTFSIGGAERQIDFQPRPGLQNCRDYPAAISGGVVNNVTHMDAFQNIVGRMLVCDDELKQDIIVAGPDWPLVIMLGTNDQGDPFGTGMMDGGAAGTGARSYKDGLDTSGFAWVPQIRVPNVENTEVHYPLLFLYRREEVDSGGAGRWRGGVGMAYAVTPYRADAIEAVTNCGGMGISTHGGMGIFGGYPSPAARFEVLKSTNLEQMFASRRIPRDIGEVEAEERFRLRSKSNGTPLEPGDVMVANVSGGGGYGDPLDREPERVATDVAAGYVSGDAARSVYGVVLGADGEIDGDATDRAREEIREQRRGWVPARELQASPPSDSHTAATGEPPRELHEHLMARDDGDRRVLACSRCEEVVGDYRDNYKLGLLVDEGPVTAIPTVIDPSFFLDEDIVFRRFCCPGCHVLMTAELCRSSEPIVEEVMFA